MPFVARLVGTSAAIIAAFDLGLWAFLVTFFPFSTSEKRYIGLVVLAGYLALAVPWLLLLRGWASKLEDGLVRQKTGQLDPLDAVVLSRLGHRLPTRTGLLQLTCWVVALGVAAPVLVQLDTPPDLVLAGAMVATTTGITLSLLLYYLATAHLGPVLEHLGGAPEQSGSVSLTGKILVICFTSLFLSGTLVGATSYVRYRVESERAHLDSTARMLEAALVLTRNHSPSIRPQVLHDALRMPLVIWTHDGRVVGQVGELVDQPLPEGAAGFRGTRRVPGGYWLMRAMDAQDQYATLGAFLSEAPLWRRRYAFWGWMGLFTSFALGVTLCVVWAASRTITGPMASLGRAANSIAAGDLTVRAPSLSLDELGQLAASFRNMANGLKALAVDVQAASTGVTEGVFEIGQLGANVRGGALEQRDGVQMVNIAVEAMHASIEHVTHDVGILHECVTTTGAAVGEMAAALEEVRRHEVDLGQAIGNAMTEVQGLGRAGKEAGMAIERLEVLSQSTSGSVAMSNASLSGLEAAAGESEATAAEVAAMAEKAGLVVEETIAGIDSVRAAVADAQQRVTDLGRRSEDINKIVDFIADVAGRTNLLSLNASIIAAQAGEHGKAFAVVADQIRDLAAQIASSTKSIGEIIRSLHNDVDGTAALIVKGDALAAEAVHRARNSGESIRVIRAATAQARETAGAIRVAVQSHATSTHEVSGLLGHIAEGTRSVASAVALINRNASAIEGLSRTTAEMTMSVGRALHEQANVGRQQLDSLEKINAILADISKAIQSHNQATGAVRESITQLGSAAQRHELAVEELSGIASRLGGRAKALAERASRFKV
jgi:methyl-accepting chemotaxis protein